MSMSLPFMKNKQKSIAGLIITQRKPDMPAEDYPYDPKDSLKAVVKDLIQAIKSDDVDAASEAIYAIYEICGAQNEEPGEHVEPHSYAAQNEAAAE